MTPSFGRIFGCTDVGSAELIECVRTYLGQSAFHETSIVLDEVRLSMTEEQLLLHPTKIGMRSLPEARQDLPHLAQVERQPLVRFTPLL